MRKITVVFFAPGDREATVRHLDKRDQDAKQSEAQQSRRLVRLCAPNQRQGCNARLECQVEVETPLDNAPASNQFPLFRATDSRECNGHLENSAPASAHDHSKRLPD